MQKASGELLADVEVIVDGSVIDAPQQFILLQEPVMIKCEQITEVLDTAILPFQRRMLAFCEVQLWRIQRILQRV